MASWIDLMDEEERRADEGPLLDAPDSQTLNLAEEMFVGHDLATWGATGLHSQVKGSWHGKTMKMDGVYDCVSIVMIGDQLTWRIEVPEELEGTSIRSSSTDVKIPRFEEYKLRHELVAASFGASGTDVPLRDVFKVFMDYEDKLTPDFIVTDTSGNIHVVEIGTSRREEIWYLAREYEKKYFKYFDALERRSVNKVVTFTIIIVTEGGVFSTVPLSQSTINDLCFRMMVGIAIENQALEKGIPLKTGEDMSERDAMRERISESVSSIEFKFREPEENKCFITEALYNRSLGGFDPSKVTEDYLICRSEEITSIKEQASQESKLASYKKLLENNDNKRHFPKPTCILPYMVMKEDLRHSVEWSAAAGGDCHEYIQDLWSSALEQARTNNGWEQRTVDELYREAVSENHDEVEKLAKERLSHRNKWNKVNMKATMTPNIKRYLQRDGLYGKQARNEIWSLARRQQQKMPFAWETETGDIDNFINSEDGFDLLDNIPPSQRQSFDLIKQAHELSKNAHFDLTVVHDWMRTNHFHAFDLMSDIVAELSLSLKQNTHTDEMILKRLRFHDVHILIKTTNSDSHIFFSLYFADMRATIKNVKGLPFRNLFKMGRGYVTEFVSLKRDKMANFLNASSRFLTLVSFWSDFYGISDMTVRSFRQNKEAMKMINVSMLISLENKAETEESITQTRYMYQEVFKSISTICKPDPMKILSKLTVIPRSRLNLWCLKRICHSFLAMVLSPPIRLATANFRFEDKDRQDTTPGDTWRGLKNFFTDGYLNSATSAVNIMYLGYLKDKNEDAEANTEWSLVEKIIEEEMKLKEERRFEQEGQADAHDLPKGKGFSYNHVIFGCTLMENRLRSKLGPQWKDILKREILDNLSRHLTHEISSLKASSMISHKDVKQQATLDDTTSTARCKVIEAIAARLETIGLNPFMDFESILKMVEETSNGVICDLFKKQQHGGLREIYVLTIESRILQLMIETISRTICSHFEEETLTHPQNKLKKLDEHKIRTAQIARARASVFVDFCSSSDKTRWNQNFIMPAMSVPLLRLTDESFHPVIIRVLNLWANKLIKLPPNVVKLMVEGKMLSSNAYEALFFKFKNSYEARDACETQLLERDHSAFLRLTTGMMQGILHYTSSLLHVSFLCAARAQTLATLKATHAEHGLRFAMTSVCSSDDSATILSVFSPKDLKSICREDLVKMFDCEIHLHTLTRYCRLFCMVESVKSTTALHDYVEFNSEFIFKNTLAIPVIKFVAACLTISESESLCRRMFEMYNLTSSLSGSGLPFLNTYMCQVAQGLLHYKTMGASTSSLFPAYHSLITDYPDISHGFFLLDKDILCGVPGLSFSRWLSMRSSARLQANASLGSNVEMDVAIDGTVVDSLVVRHGEHNRWYKLLDRICEGELNVKSTTMKKGKTGALTELDKELLEERMCIVNSDPDLLYTNPKTIGQLRVKLISKALTPGVSRSLAKGNPLTQSFASTAYTLYSHCFTRTSTHKMGDLTFKKRKKLSLISSLIERRDHANKLIESEVKLPDFNEIFPLSEVYWKIQNVVSLYTDYSWVPTHDMRQRRCVVRMSQPTERLPLTLLQCVGNIWCGLSIRASMSILKRCWESYKLKFPWLRENHRETMEASPFDRFTDLHGFIAAQRTSSRVYTRVGASPLSDRFSHQISGLIRKCSSRRLLLEPMESLRGRGNRGRLPDGVKRDNLTREQLESELSLSLGIPLRSEKERLVHECMNNLCDLRPRVSDWMDCPKWEFEVGLMALFSQDLISGPEVHDAVRLKGAGIKIMFTKEQDRVVENGIVSWKGEGQALVEAEGIHMRITLEDEVATRIEVNDFKPLKRRPDLMDEVLKRMGSVASSVCSKESVGVEGRFTGRSFESYSGNGTPVRVVSDLEVGRTDSDRLQFRIRENDCAIVATGVREYTMVRFLPKAWACTTTARDDTQECDFWGAWAHQRPVHPGTAVMSLEKIDKWLEGSDNTTAGEKTRAWVRDSLQGKLKMLGIGLSGFGQKAATMTEIDDDVPEVDEKQILAWLEDMNDDGLGLGDLMASHEHDVVESVNKAHEEDPQEYPMEMFTIESIYDPSNPESPLRDTVCNWISEEVGPVRSVLTPSSATHFMQHPFWIKFINTCKETDSWYFDKLMQGRPVDGDNIMKETAKRIQRILRIPPVEEPLSGLAAAYMMAQKIAVREGVPRPDWWGSDE
uniref:RNA-directed RNA polymerase L n=1 Tax=Hemipteran phenui-related virus OKIAV285 TaxID=2746250 RepID=A0A7D7JFN9_9VIRU|nr:RNA-dependent RNA polymerase [Hemipteran phenui-related virus OKIAV285]